MAEQRAGHRLEQLVERAEAAGQRDEGVGGAEHQLLALSADAALSVMTFLPD